MVKQKTNCLVGPTSWWVETVWNLNSVLVVRTLLELLETPLEGDLRADNTAVLNQEGVWNWVRNVVLDRVEWTGKGLVEEASWGRTSKGWPLGVLVTSLVGDELENVGTDIPATEGVQAPVGLDGGDLRVMVVELWVVGADKVGWNGVTEEDREDAVTNSVGVVLVKGDENGSLLHEVGVVEERLHEVADKLASNGDRRVVAIVGHVWGDEHPLWELVVLEVLVEHGEVLDLGKTVGLDVGVEDDWWIVLADVVVLAGGIYPREALETRVWHVLLVSGPRDTTVLKKVDNGRDVAGNLVEVVVVHTKVVTRDGGDVVWLRWVSDTKVVVEGDTLGREPSEVWVVHGGAVVGVLAPKDHEAVEGATRNMAGWALGLCGGLGSKDIGGTGGGVLGNSGTSEGEGGESKSGKHLSGRNVRTVCEAE